MESVWNFISNNNPGKANTMPYKKNINEPVRCSEHSSSEIILKTIHFKYCIANKLDI